MQIQGSKVSCEPFYFVHFAEVVYPCNEIHYFPFLTSKKKCLYTICVFQYFLMQKIYAHISRQVCLGVFESVLF